MANLYQQTFAVNQRLNIRNNNRIFEILVREIKNFHCDCTKLKLTARAINLFVDEELKVKIPKRICHDHKEKWTRGKIYEA